MIGVDLIEWVTKVQGCKWGKVQRYKGGKVQWYKGEQGTKEQRDGVVKWLV